jgi:hypothetical protein
MAAIVSDMISPLFVDSLVSLGMALTDGAG